MPPKKNRNGAITSASKEICCICCQVVTVGKDELLFCAGDCQRWLHRYCASVTLEQYKDITDNGKTFSCPCCYRQHQQEQISQLTSTVDALKLEIAELKGCISTLTAARNAEPRSYATVTATTQRMNRPAHGRRRKLANPAKTTSSGDSSAARPTVPTDSASSPILQYGENSINREKERVEGASRIWGTVRESTANSVKNVITRLCKPDLSRNLVVKRKDRFNPVSNKTRWWYIVRADESLLVELENDWECVQLQTSWKLEQCFRTVVVQAGTIQGQPQTIDHPQTIQDQSPTNPSSDSQFIDAEMDVPSEQQTSTIGSNEATFFYRK